jgi:hypothetical protein
VQVELITPRIAACHGVKKGVFLVGSSLKKWGLTGFNGDLW